MVLIGMEKFIDRQAAGITLAQYLGDYANHPKAIVLALPRGGVPVGYEVAKALSIPLDVFIVRKLGVPGHEELAMGAIATGNTVVLNDALQRQLHINPSAINAVLTAEKKELARRERLYRGNRPFPELKGKTILLVDDGIATGSSMSAAIKALKPHQPAQVIIAVPVGARSTCDEMASLVDRLVCPLKPIELCAVGLWYEHFPQTSDHEVLELLKLNSQRAS